MSNPSGLPSGNKSILVVGGGLSGMTAAIEAAEVGYETYIIEKQPYLGGRVAQLNQYFPKLCPPYCGLEINFRRIKTNPRIHYFTLSEVESVSGEAGNFDVKIKRTPRYVNDKCTACNDCVAVCPEERPNDFNFGMNKTKAIYLPHEMAFPMKYVIDSKYCKDNCSACVTACKYDAIEPDMKSKEMTLNVASIIYSTGWKPYDATKMDNLGMTPQNNIISNIMMERIAAPNGPTRGKLIRPTDQKEAKTIVFVQCAGSRDESHLPYCSSICCMASLKQTTYFRKQYPDSKIYIFYIDLRTPGKYEKFLSNVRKDENVVFIKGKVAKITEDPKTQNLIVEAENAITFEKVKVEADLVVLASGMESSLSGNGLSNLGVETNPEGFISPELQKDGIFSAGVAKAPVDVTTSIQDATGVALKAIQSMRRS